MEDDAIVDITNNEPGDLPLDPTVSEFVPNHQPPADPVSIKFPSNSILQRSSNVIASDPHTEFLQTALDTCRSTIAQQETEILMMKLMT